MNQFSIRSSNLASLLLTIAVVLVASMSAIEHAEAITWEQCASEGQTCTIPGSEPAMVRYGKNGQFHYIDDVTSSISCNNSVFGDSNPNIPKECWYSTNLLPDHPQKSESVMFLGDESDGRLYPGERIERGTEGPFSAHAYLEYQTDGNLVFYSKSNYDPNYIVDFASSTNNFCAGYAELDPYYGMAVYDCNGVQRWTLFSSALGNHTNFHLSIEFGELRLFNMDNQSIAWNAKNNGLNGTFYSPELPISSSWMKNIWLQQGWDHVQGWDEATVDEFVAQFSSNPTDPHTDAHRMMQSIDDHQKYRLYGEDANFGPVYYYNLLQDWRNDFDCNPDLGTCLSEEDNHLVEQAHESILVMNQYLTIMSTIFNEISKGDFTDDPLADLAFEQVFSNTLDYESAVNAYNWLFDYNTEQQDDLNRLLAFRNTSVYNNKWTRLLGRNPYRTDRIEADININLAEAWNVLRGPLTFPDGSNVVSAVQSLNFVYLLSLPKYDETKESFTYSHTLRVGLFDGVFSDGTVAANQAINFLLPQVATAALSGDVGVFGNHEYKWKVTKSMDGETNVQRTYSNTLGVAISGYVTPANGWAQWSDTPANGRFQRPDWTNIASQESEMSALGIEAIYDTEMAGQVADGSWSDTGVAEHPPGSFIHNIEQIINAYDSLTPDETAFMNRLLEYDSTGNIIEQGFQVTPMQTINQYVTMNPDNTISYNGRGPVTSFTLSPTLHAVVQEGWNNGETSLEVMASMLNSANQGVDEDAAKSFLHHLAFGVKAYSKRRLQLASGGAFSAIIKLDGLTVGQKQGVIVGPLLASLAGAELAAGATAGALGWYSALLPSKWRAAITTLGADIGGITAASIAARYLGEKQAKMQVGGIGFATLAPGRWDIPVTVLNNSASGTPFFGSMITTDFGIKLNVGALRKKVVWGDSSRRLERNVNSNWKSTALNGYSHPSKSPVLLARMQESDEVDTAALRIRNMNNQSFDVMIEEESSADLELAHSDETIGYLTFNEGPISDMHGTVVGEAGNIDMGQINGTAFETVIFDRAYTDPVVVASVTTYNGAEPVHVSVDAVSATSANIQLEEWDYLDGSHITETVSYVVLEKGLHRVDSGELLAVGSVMATSNTSEWSAGVFGVNYDTDSVPVVITQAQTDGPHALVTRLKDVTNSSFKTQLQVEESKRGIVGSGVQAEVGFVALGEHAYPNEYCLVSGGNTNFEWIESVGLNGASVTTGDDSGYRRTSNSALDFVLNKGSNNTLTLEPGFFSNSYPEGWSVWVDYNQDGQFEASEQVATATPSAATQTVTISVPGTANLGATVMRIAMEYNGITPYACAAMYYGEYEDYSVTIH